MGPGGSQRSPPPRPYRTEGQQRSRRAAARPPTPQRHPGPKEELGRAHLARQTRCRDAAHSHNGNRVRVDSGFSLSQSTYDKQSQKRPTWTTQPAGGRPPRPATSKGPAPCATASPQQLSERARKRARELSGPAWQEARCREAILQVGQRDGKTAKPQYSTPRAKSPPHVAHP